jgi:ABC-type uncharacterized transport system ATPase subunit
MTALIATEGMTMRFGGVVAVDNVTLAVGECERRCLIGPNGAGKSTFFRCLTGQYRPTAGRILWRGTDITGLAPFAIARLGIGIKTQVPLLFDGLSVIEGVTLAARRRHGRRAADAKARATLERIGIAALAKRLPGLLAHGERQLAELAMVVAPEPELIILDEPTAGMSAEETARVAALIRDLNRDAAIVVVEHDMQFIRAIARTVTVFHQGRVLIEDDVDRVLSDPRVHDVYLGRAVGPADCTAPASARLGAAL